MKHLFALLLFVTLPAWAGDFQTFEAGERAWDRFKAAQPRACKGQFDSVEIFRGRRTEVAVLVLHGFGQSPYSMRPYIDFFRGFDVNLVAPRLAGHYNARLEDLSEVSYRQWQQNAAQAFAAAQRLGRRVVIVGYSLGALLGSELALRHPSQVSALVLLSPAWRIRESVNFLTDLGSFLHLNGNQIIGRPALCEPKKHFYSSEAGREVKRLVWAIEGSRIRSPEFSVFRRLRPPVFMALVQGDRVVDTQETAQIFAPTLVNGHNTLLVYPGRTHTTLVENIGQLKPLRARSSGPYSDAPITSRIGGFLGEALGRALPRGQRGE